MSYEEEGACHMRRRVHVPSIQCRTGKNCSCTHTHTHTHTHVRARVHTRTHIHTERERARASERAREREMYIRIFVMRIHVPSIQSKDLIRVYVLHT